MPKIKKANRSNPYPLVGIPCDVKHDGFSNFHSVGEKYINAIVHAADVCPVLIPAQGPGEELKAVDQQLTIDRLLHNLDGLFLSGSVSNIEPKNYSEDVSLTPDDHDPQRDSLTLPLIRAAIEKQLPILAVCRGMQELNVALGGSLHQQVHQVEGKMDHREDKTLDRAGQYQDSHLVNLVKGGVLFNLAGSNSIKVNSLHGQGINRLGRKLVPEAMALDGLIEAIRLDDDQHYVLAVQWHPEWKFQDNPFYTAIFRSFGEAVRTSLNIP